MATTLDTEYSADADTDLDADPADLWQTSVWTQLKHEFARSIKTGAARAQYSAWANEHGWNAHSAEELALALWGSPAALNELMNYYRQGSKLAQTILIEAFRPALMKISRYARIDDCEQLDRSAVRAQTTLTVFYEVLATASPQCPDVKARLYGETLKRVTKAHGQPIAFPADIEDRSYDGYNTFLDTLCLRGTHHLADSTAAIRPGLDWEAVETRGLVRDMIDAAHDQGILDSLDRDLLYGRFLGDALVPVPTLARSMNESVSKCETRIKRAQDKLASLYTSRRASIAA
ncbi:hypothetical protein P5V30_20155 [Mycobacteroides abscessus subsp. abscessus]|uniref:hypothetical protein n=1 Tax=Mycobacteroides abscessus TaxID=36809 RepID=UPI00092BFF73|nr:hypothetical protein [Mycobacteroides abscessus]MDO2986845.1 hypothetical protein [Mycobacteroides abscessus subsp. abscessus]SID35752.1 Uncharacterised protein [Mycobacteroides abscessus subsp. abscessus]SIJ96730.1 Uncharacterised protein [Mycobacteroides abscessus subsp. abscessus]